MPAFATLAAAVLPMAPLLHEPEASPSPGELNVTLEFVGRVLAMVRRGSLELCRARAPSDKQCDKGEGMA